MQTSYSVALLTLYIAQISTITLRNKLSNEVMKSLKNYFCTKIKSPSSSVSLVSPSSHTTYTATLVSMDEMPISSESRVAGGVDTSSGDGVISTRLSLAKESTDLSNESISTSNDCLLYELNNNHCKIIYEDKDMPVAKKMKVSNDQSNDIAVTIPSSKYTTNPINQKSLSQALMNSSKRVKPMYPILDHLESSWREKLSSEFTKSYFMNLQEFVDKERSHFIVYPPVEETFTAFRLCPYDEVRVVIIGQDPYHGLNQAHGLAFSVKSGVQNPPTLNNIFLEAQNDVNIRKPSHGNLEAWAKQGVLLLNTCLTVRKGEANSHQKKGCLTYRLRHLSLVTEHYLNVIRWETFTDAVVKELGKKQGLVYLLWGNPASAKCKSIDRSKNLVITTSHPSPLGAYKTDKPFIGSNMEGIDWHVMEVSSHGMGSQGSRSSHSPSADYIRRDRAEARAIIILTFAVNQKSIDDLALSISDPKSPNYGKHLSKEEIKRLTENVEGEQAVRKYLADHGIDRITEHSSGSYISAEAPVELWERLLNTKFYEYESGINGQKIIRAEEYSLPSFLAFHVQTVLNTVQFPVRMHGGPKITPMTDTH